MIESHGCIPPPTPRGDLDSFWRSLASARVSEPPSGKFRVIAGVFDEEVWVRTGIIYLIDAHQVHVDIAAKLRHPWGRVGYLNDTSTSMSFIILYSWYDGFAIWEMKRSRMAKLSRWQVRLVTTRPIPRFTLSYIPTQTPRIKHRRVIIYCTWWRPSTTYNR